jgi:hypothetical protein
MAAQPAAMQRTCHAGWQRQGLERQMAQRRRIFWRRVAADIGSPRTADQNSAGASQLKRKARQPPKSQIIKSQIPIKQQSIKLQSPIAQMTKRVII